MNKQKLEMDFLDEAGKRFRIGLDDPKEDLDSMEIEGAMETIIEANIFESNQGNLVKIEAARIITTSINEMKF